MQLSFVLCNE